MHTGVIEMGKLPVLAQDAANAFAIQLPYTHAYILRYPYTYTYTCIQASSRWASCQL